jgi:anti-sigma B factor antagonist
MACTVTIRRDGDVTIVSLSGRLTLGDGSGVLRGAIRDLIRQDQRLVLLNLAEVTHLDSSGLGELVSSYASITQHGGEIRLLHAQRKVEDVLRATRLHAVFHCFTDEALALRSFTQRAAARADLDP